MREREDKTTKGGDPYVILKLGNASGVLSVNVWKEHVPAVAGLRPGQVVQVIGEMDSYKGAPQLKLTAPPRTVAASAGDLDQFLPRISVSTDELWARVDGWRAEMKGALRKAVDLFFADDVVPRALRSRPRRTARSPRADRRAPPAQLRGRQHRAHQRADDARRREPRHRRCPAARHREGRGVRGEALRLREHAGWHSSWGTSSWAP